MCDFEKTHVHDIYNNISEHFSITRKIMWPKVCEFIDSFKSDSLILDIGCGNGKNMGTRHDCEYIGIDMCERLMKQCKYKDNCKFIAGDCLNLPFKDETFEYAICIAVIHHLSTEERRLKSIKELSRILKTGGYGLIYVWAYEQKRFENEKKQDVDVKWLLQKKYNKCSETDEVYYRYYHLFKENELEELILNDGNLGIIESGNQYNNWYCIVKKLD